MKKEIIKKVNATMVEQLINFENYKINALAEIIKFVNNSSIPNKEEVIEEYKQHLQEEEEPNQIVLGGEFNQYVLKYDDFTHSLYFTNGVIDISGVKIKDELDYFNYLDIATILTEDIEIFFKHKIIEDCGEYWEIKE